MSTLLLMRTGAVAGRFARVLREVCATEGVVDLELVDLDTVPRGRLPELLARHDTILLARAPLWAHEVDAVLSRVEQGCGLVTIRPSRALVTGLGFVPQDRQHSAGYLWATGAATASAGLSSSPVQVPVLTDRVALPADRHADVVASWTQLCDSPPEPAGSDPCVVLGRHGNGRVMVFLYDLADAVVRLRQGNPLRVGTRTHGSEPYRQMDLIDEEVDPRCWHNPQADVHGQLLVAGLEAVSPGPLLRWWYYPASSTTTLIVQDSDDDWSTPEEFDELLASAREFDVDLTIYLMMGQRPSHLGPDDVHRLREEGHSFGIHHDALVAVAEHDDQDVVLPEIVRRDTERFSALFGGRPIANRNHCLVWAGWQDLAKVFESVGLRMEFNAQGTNEAWTNYLFGSARPMRHVDLDGTVIDVFQQPTQIYDDSTLVERLGQNAAAEAAAVIAHLERCRVELFQPLSMQSHAVSFASYSKDFFRRIWDHARRTKIDIWSSEQWARETDARDRSTIRHRGTEVEVTAYGYHRQRTLMWRTDCGPAARHPEVLVDDTLVVPVRRQVHGASYAMVEVAAAPEGIRHRLTFGGAQDGGGGSVAIADTGRGGHHELPL